MHKFNSVMAAAAIPLSLFALNAPAVAAHENTGGVDRLQIKPILDARARLETVDQDALDAEALTLRLRAGAEVTVARVSFLAEAEGTVALEEDYNGFPFPNPGESQWRPRDAVVADPENAEINRLQLQYKLNQGVITLGRQRINLDDQRWVGSVGWRQNEQTFAALRGQVKLGRVNADLIYAISQRTIFGCDAGLRTAYDGDFLLAGVSTNPGPLKGKLFAYLLDYDEPFFLANSSQTYGGVLAGTVPLAADTKVALRASYARQSDHGANPFEYTADYWSVEGDTNLAGFTVAAGWERLGSDGRRAVQTPAATLHKFNGWADMFLTTPPAGLDDAYVSIGRTFDGIKILPGFNVNATFHQFDSATGNLEYGTEWDASVGFKAAGLGWLLKFADYNARSFGADTRKLWLQTEWSF